MSTQVITPTLEQGNIGSSGNSSSSSRLRSKDYIALSGAASSVIITAQSVSGKAVQVNLLGYETSTTTSSQFDLYWYESGHEFDISNYTKTNFIRIVLRYQDNSDILPDDIASCEISATVKSAWFLTPGGLPDNDAFIPLPVDPLADEIPKMRWRITPGVNNGLPYHELLPLEKLSSAGAFMNAVNLEYVYIPRSCKKIGEWAFTNTKLRRVTIAADCEYYQTTFPKGCQIDFYNNQGGT